MVGSGNHKSQRCFIRIQRGVFTSAIHCGCDGGGKGGL